MIYPLDGPDLGVAYNDKYFLCEWRGKGRVVFSAAQRGNAMDCHFAVDKSALREVKQAINEFIDWVFDTFKWCTMILAAINHDSVERLVKKCGFDYLISRREHHIYMRNR